MLYSITHKTIYDYGDVVPECFNIVRLKPRPVFDQRCVDHQLEIVPKPDDYVQREDFFGNGIEQFSINVPHESLSVTAVNHVEVTARDYPQLESTPAWESVANLGRKLGLMEEYFNRNSPHIRVNNAIANYARG